MLAVGGGHQLYVQDWGKKDASLPIIFLHGGPGYGASDRHKRRFDPTKQRVIFFDQRGVGNSTPFGSLEHNTTQDLVEDIEKIADKLRLQKYIITGSSWGSALALAYAIAHPKRIHTMVLSGIFTGTKAEIEYFRSGVFRTHFPEVWEKLLARTPKKYHNDPIKYHYEQILHGSPAAQRKSGYIYENTLGPLLRLDDRFSEQPFDEETFDPTSPRIEVHYMSQSCFLPENYILDNAHKLTMPIWLVQGRYDFICPPQTAYELHKRLPNSELVWTQAGHSNDRGTHDVMRSLLLQLSKENS